MANNNDHAMVSTPDVDNLLEKHGLEIDGDQHLRWSADSRQHPRNWHWKRKLYDAGLIIMLEMLMLVKDTLCKLSAPCLVPCA